MRLQPVSATIFLLAAAAVGAPPKLDIAAFRLRTPGDKGDINQASDLHFGRLGSRFGLWTVCDRNGGPTAGRIYFFSRASLGRAEPGVALVADEEFTIARPEGEWSAFAAANRGAGSEAIEEVRRRILRDEATASEPYLDLECITIGRSPHAPHEPRLFVVAEEPYSTVLELEIGGVGQAKLVAIYSYHEKASEQGRARNDGLEGLTYAGTADTAGAHGCVRPALATFGRFYFAEEGTRDCGGDSSAFLFFCDPRLGVGRITNGDLAAEELVSGRHTEGVRKLGKGASQTLNGLCVLADGRVLAVDRNGGLLLMTDPGAGTVRTWLDLYNLQGVSLRKLLADFPGVRRMPYVSIEGVAVDHTGALWLVDDPAIPEPFRNSCAVRIRGLERDLVSAPQPSRPAN